MAYERTKKSVPKRRLRIWLAGGGVLAVVAILVYVYGYRPAAENENIHVRFKEALLTEDIAFFEQTVEYANVPLTRAEAIRFVRWLKDEPALRGEAIAEVARDRQQTSDGEGLFRLTDTGEGRFGFADYQIELLPQRLTVTADRPLTNVWVDGTQAGRVEKTGDTVTIDRMPGRYDVKAVAVVGGETIVKEETVTLVEAAELAFELEAETGETIAGQFDIERLELIAIEVEARTGHPLETMDGLMNKRESTVLEQLGEPSDQNGVWRYEGFDVTFENGRVNRIDIDLDKRPDDMVALLGEPEERIDTELGTEWRYDRSFIESIFTLFGLQTDKRFIERDGKLYVVIS